MVLRWDKWNYRFVLSPRTATKALVLLTNLNLAAARISFNFVIADAKQKPNSDENEAAVHYPIEQPQG